MSDTRCYLDVCLDGHVHHVIAYDLTLDEYVPTEELCGCVVYSCEVDGEVSWASHIPDGPMLLKSINGSYDTYDRQTGTLLLSADYVAEIASAIMEPAVRHWWKPWTWRRT